MHRKYVAFTMFLFAFLLQGCSGATFKQSIKGYVIFSRNTTHGNMVIFVKDKDGKSCTGEANIAEINKDGGFEIIREVNSGTLSVRVQSDIVCVIIDNSPKTIWKYTYGPAPKELKLECDLNKSTEKCVAYFDGRK